MDYKELFELINNLPDGCIRDLSEIVRKNQETHSNGFTLEKVKTQIENFHGKVINEK
jgi:hypothetical protein